MNHDSKRLGTSEIKVWLEIILKIQKNNYEFPYSKADIDKFNNDLIKKHEQLAKNIQKTAEKENWNY